jgi:hypothetical protein
MGGLAGGLYWVFQLVGSLFFAVLVGPKRAERIGKSLAVVGGIIFCSGVGSLVTWAFKIQFNDDLSLGLGGALIGGLIGFLLSLILVAYVSHVEREEEWERRREKRRAEMIAKGLDPDKSCFVATAVFGSADAPETKDLRSWRDRHLLPNSSGRLLVGFYYYVSPRIARVLERSEILKITVRCLLKAFLTLLHKIGSV